MKTGRNEPCPCGSGKKYKRCCLVKEKTAKEPAGELPIYKVLITKPKGSRHIVISRERPDGNLQFISLLVDEWKMGLKDCYGSHSISKTKFHGFLSRNPFMDISLDECKKIIKRGLLIAKELGLREPEEFDRFKHIVGDLDDVEVTGSLYKCFECGKGDLPDETVEFIKDVTKHDMERGLCGREGETMIFFVCERCKSSE